MRHSSTPKFDISLVENFRRHRHLKRFSAETVNNLPSFFVGKISAVLIYHQPKTFHQSKPTTDQIIMLTIEASNPIVHQFVCLT